MDSPTIPGPSEVAHSESTAAGSPEPGNTRRTFQERVLEFESKIIAEALKQNDGRVSRAARKLGLTHQGLCYIINHRHKELLPMRRPIRARRKSIINKITPPARTE